jgi:DNA mismatch endonuclease Vsr
MLKQLRDALGLEGFGEVPHKRSKVMSAIRSTGNRTTEKRLKMALVRAGLRGWTVRTRVHACRPDFVFEKSRLAVFTDGCFWHGCSVCRRGPMNTNGEYWAVKIKYNRAKDRRVTRELASNGWTVIRVWEHELKRSPDRAVEKIRKALS